MDSGAGAKSPTEPAEEMPELVDEIEPEERDFDPDDDDLDPDEELGDLDDDDLEDDDGYGDEDDDLLADDLEIRPPD